MFKSAISPTTNYIFLRSWLVDFFIVACVRLSLSLRSFKAWACSCNCLIKGRVWCLLMPTMNYRRLWPFVDYMQGVDFWWRCLQTTIGHLKFAIHLKVVGRASPQEVKYTLKPKQLSPSTARNDLPFMEGQPSIWHKSIPAQCSELPPIIWYFESPVFINRIRFYCVE